MERRRFLKGSGALFVAGVAGLSGCAGLGDGSDGTSTASTDRLETWLPDPQAFDRDLDHYQFQASAPAAKREALSVEGFSPYAQDTSGDINVGTIPGSEVDLTFSVSTAVDNESYDFSAYFGSFDADWLGTKLANRNYDSFRGGGQDFSLYEIQNGDDTTSRVSAISEDVLIAGRQTNPDGQADGVEIVETLIDASEGNVTRYTDSSEATVLEDMADLMSALPDGQDFSGRTQPPGEETIPEDGRFRNLVARGETSLFDGSGQEVTTVLVFADSDDIQTRNISSYIEESGEFSGFIERPNETTDGRVVTIEGRSA